MADISDVFLFLKIIGGGDELQGIKRGIMEMVDVIFINKVDEENIFSKTNKNEIWTMIIEKAWAKVKGGYAQSEGGDPSEVIYAFTNFKNESYPINDTSEEKIRKEF